MSHLYIIYRIMNILLHAIGSIKTDADWLGSVRLVHIRLFFKFTLNTHTHTHSHTHIHTSIVNKVNFIIYLISLILILFTSYFNFM
jgi:hypothetical protein